MTGGKGLAGFESRWGLWVGSGLLGRHCGVSQLGEQLLPFPGDPQMRPQEADAENGWDRAARAASARLSQAGAGAVGFHSCPGSWPAASPEVMHVNPGSWPVTAQLPLLLQDNTNLLGGPTFQLQMLLGVPEAPLLVESGVVTKEMHFPGARGCRGTVCSRGGGVGGQNNGGHGGANGKPNTQSNANTNKTRESSQLCNKYCKAHLVSFFFFSSQI